MALFGKLGGRIRRFTGTLNFFLSHYIFNAFLVGGAFYHLALIASHNCHGDSGERGFFCSKAWENCKRLEVSGVAKYVNGSLQCKIRDCSWFDFYDPVACKPIMLDYAENRSFFAILYEATNYWLRWIYSAIIVTRMLCGGLILSEGSFFRDFYCIMDLLIMASAWVNIYYPHGNMMFLMVLRFNIMIAKSTHPAAAPLRIITNSIINGVGELTCLYTLITFFMGFFALLAMSLIGSKGDFHNRCAVPLRGMDGTSFTYEPIMPPRTCRMDHLYNPDEIKSCYGDVWATESATNFVPASRIPGAVNHNSPGCRGTCASVPFYRRSTLGNQLNLTVNGRNENYGENIDGTDVYCIGPNLFPIERKTIPPTTAELLPLSNYKAANLTNWPPILDLRSWDNIGSASVSIYTVYYRSAWAEVFDATRASTSSAVFVVWVFIVMMVTYYILNTSVGIICRNYSVSVEQEADAVEARRKAALPPSLDDDGNDDEEVKEDDEDDEEEQDLEGTEEMTIREKQQKHMLSIINENPCGRGCGRLPIVVGKSICYIFELLGEFLARRVKLLGMACQPICEASSLWALGRSCVKNAVTACCRNCISVAIWFAIPNAPVKDFQQGIEGFAPLEWIGMASSFGCLLTLLMQQDTVNNYKCGCTAAQMDAAKNVTALKSCTPAGECLDQSGGFASDFLCVSNVCMPYQGAYGYACFNPLWNWKLEQLRLLTGNPPSQPSAIGWESDRTVWCTFGTSLHYVLYGWAFVLLLETFINWFGHQGWRNYLTDKLRGVDKSRQASVLKSIPVISMFFIHGVNVKNIVDAVANLATAAGILLTELSFGSTQILNGRVAYNTASSAFDSSSFLSTASLSWTFKFLRIAILCRFVVRIGLLERNPWYAAVIRGLRGVDKLLLGQSVILYTIFLFAIIGKEIFDYGYSIVSGPFTGYADFHDVPNALVPLLNIMASGSFYEYAKEATSVFSVPGFVYMSFYYFIVNFQVLNIFIAIIVQNYVLKDDEKIEAQIAILRTNFENQKTIKSWGASAYVEDSSYEESWGDFRAHYNELLKGAQLSLKSLMQFQRSEVKTGGPFSKETEDYLAGIDSSKDMMAKVNEEEKTEQQKQDERVDDVQKKLSIRRHTFHIEKQNPDETKKKLTLYARLKKMLTKLLADQRWNVFTAIIVVFSTAMAVITTLPSAIEFAISLVLFAFFLLEMIIKIVRYGVFGEWRFEDSPQGGSGGIVFLIRGLRSKKEMRRVTAGYFLRRWCILEFLIIVVQVLDIYISLLPKELQFTDPGLFKGLRAVRIIRLLSNLQNMQMPESLSWHQTSPFGYQMRVPVVQFADSNPIKTIMLALGASLPSIFLLMVIAFGMLIVFSLIGMEQFAGLLTTCSNDDDLYNKASLCNNSDSDCHPGYPGQCDSGRGVCILDQQHCFGNKLVLPSIYRSTNWRSVSSDVDFIFPEPRTWVSARLNFDTAPQAFFATFCSVSRSGVAFLMRSLGSVSGRTTAPISDGSSNFYAYVIILNLLVGVFICQVVIGIILTNLQLKSGYAFHTKEQLVWPATKNMFDRYMPDPKIYRIDAGSSDPVSKNNDEANSHPLKKVLSFFQDRFKMIQQSWKFQLMVTLTIFLNIATLFSYSYDSAGDEQLTEYWIGFACFVVYVLEAFVKIGAEPRRYFSNSSDQIDFLLTIWNMMELFVNPHILGIDVSLASLRMFRLFNLLMKIDAMIQLVKMITGGLLEALASGILLGFVMFVFGCVGTRFFSFLKDGNVMSPTQFGFTDLPESLITLFKLSSSTDQFLLDIIRDSEISAPLCTAPTWIPYGAPSFANPNPFGKWKNQDMGYADITTDCGNAQSAYIFFLFYIMTCNYVLLPTYIAVVLNNVFEESVKSYSLVKEEELKLFVEAWVLTFGRKDKLTFPVHKGDDEGDERKKVKQRHDFTQFDDLLQTLDMKSCRLCVEKNSAAYKLATTKLREEKGKPDSSSDLKPVVVDYKKIAVILLSVIEKVRPVTIVDRLRRDLAVKILEEESKRPPERKKKAREGKLHANINLPAETRERLNKTPKLKSEDLVFSYNIYVVLDQLLRLDSELDPIDDTCHAVLKKLVEEDDEDLFVYFEEYVERSGPDYSKEEQSKTMLRFKKKAFNIYSRSPHFKEKSSNPAAKKESNRRGSMMSIPEAAGEANHAVQTALDEPQHDLEDTDDDFELGTLDSEADDTGASEAGDELYGQVVDKENLDLKNW
eukprot:CAMPEP_0172178204 /NCGR_PEP_ID=MMETSP1050-20130122/15890_1 /TAXON_ID=233186 /ORGANISM="Cryptomonas curvata, Strain CCAP979/52" /LENGTH=2219 /DNA_ID=CAMNT_0012850865 /DNA_START=81 /DNA_END=6737 /DNA_ORIENTATION=+